MNEVGNHARKGLEKTVDEQFGKEGKGMKERDRQTESGTYRAENKERIGRD